MRGDREPERAPSAESGWNSHSANTPPITASGTAIMMSSGCRKLLNWLASTM